MEHESEALQEQANLASKRSGGCTYYSPPGEEEGPSPWGGATTRTHKPGVTATTGEGRQREIGNASPEIEHEDVSKTSAEKGAGVKKEEGVGDQGEGVDTARGKSGRAGRRAADAAFEFEEGRSEGGGSRESGKGRTRAKRRRQEEPEKPEEEVEEEERDVDGTASDAGSKRRRAFFALGREVRERGALAVPVGGVA